MSPPEIAEVDLYAARGVPFTDTTYFEGQDYSSSTFRVEIRHYRDAPGAPLIPLDTVSGTAEGVSVSVTTENGLPVSAVTIRINETTIEGLQYTSPRGGDLRLQYALDVTGGGFGKHRRMQGAFIVGASANG